MSINLSQEMSLEEQMEELPEQKQMRLLIREVIALRQAMQQLDKKVEPLLDFYTKVQALGWLGKIALALVAALGTLAGIWKTFFQRP